MSNNSKLKILFIEDLPSDVDLAVLELRREHLIFDYHTVCTREELHTALKDFKPNLIISDYMMPSYDGMKALIDVMEFDKDLPFILFTGSINEEIAVKCIKTGAIDYVIKEHMTRLPFAVKEALEQVRIKKEKRASDLLLQESEEKIQSIFRAAPVGIGLVVKRMFIEVNDTFCRMSGYSREELIGRNSEIIYPSKEEYELVGIEKYKQISSLGTGSIETRFKRKDGVLLNILMSSTPLDIKDLLKGVTFTAMDITSRKQNEDEVKSSLSLLNASLESTADGILIADGKGGIIKWNQKFAEMWDLPADLLNNKDDNAAINHILEKLKDPDKFFEIVQSLYHNPDRTSFDILEFKDGRVFERYSQPQKIDDKVVGRVWSFRDVTTRHKRDSELRKLSRAVEQNPVSIVITNTEGIIEYVNPKMCEVTGFSMGELIGKNPRVLSSGEKSIQEYKVLWDTIKSGNDWRGEFHNRKKNGELYWESATLSPIKDEKEEITHFLGIKEDISSRKALEESTRESEKRYRELFLNNPIPTYIFDVTTLEFVEVNDAAIESYGYSRAEFASMTLKDLRIKEEIPQLMESIARMGKDTFHSTSMRHLKKNGTLFPVEIISHSLPEKNGRKTRLVTVTDITERVKAAEQMTLAREKAEASDRIKTTFLNNISHEVRTPLNGILGFAEIMNQPGLSDNERKESMSRLYQSSDRLLNTITSYMDISLLTSGAMSVNIKDFYPAHILGNLLEIYQPLCSQKKLKLFLDIPSGGEGLFINSDPEVLRKILGHLLDNAIKFTEKGNIHLGFTNSISDVIFFVNDTGIGIQKESLDQIFDRFAKEDRGPQRISEGSGLGLSIAKGLAELLGGRISVESEPDSGSSFTLKLSLKSDKGTATGNKSEKQRSNRNDNFTILIAEDDDTNFFYLNAILSREFGSKILHAVNGREAIDLFRANTDIKLVLMDIKMPEIDGIEATRQIKELRSEVPVIAITAYAMSGDEERVIAAGCDGYLSKPISKDKLLRKIAEFVKI